MSAPAPDPTPKPIGYEMVPIYAAKTSTPRAPRGFDDAFDITGVNLITVPDAHGKLTAFLSGTPLAPYRPIDAGACRKLASALLSVAADIEGTANIRSQLDALLAEADRLEQIDALLAEIDRLEQIENLAEIVRLEQIGALLAEIDRLEHLAEINGLNARGYTVDEAHADAAPTAHTVHTDGTGAPR